jgi:hypothetical protein
MPSLDKRHPLAFQCIAIGLTCPVMELRFHPTRRWKFDYAWLGPKVALEVQGGLFIQGRHSRGPALLKEHEKLNAAARLGWRVIFTTPRDIKNGNALALVESVLRPAADSHTHG